MSATLPQFEENKETRVPVKMIAPRDLFRDNIYGTGDWDRDQVKLVPVSIAAKMFKHIDTYEPATAKEAVKSAADEVKEQVKVKPDPQEAEQELRDTIEQMNRDSAVEYAAVHYGHKIPGNASAEAARAELVSLVDRFGIQ